MTDLIQLIVQTGATPTVLKMELIGMDPSKKYATDPMLSPQLYKDCEIWTIIQSWVFHKQTLILPYFLIKKYYIHIIWMNFLFVPFILSQLLHDLMIKTNKINQTAKDWISIGKSLFKTILIIFFRFRRECFGFNCHIRQFIHPWPKHLPRRFCICSNQSIVGCK